MFNYIKGKIVEISANYIVIENDGIGYELYVSNPYSYELETSFLAHVYQKVSEDDITLYGFKEKEEKKMFLDLISVKGIGAKTALVILEVTSVDSLKQAIIEKNIEYLIKFPKVGKKSAQQIILDLENKYKDDALTMKQLNPNTLNDKTEVLEAMEALGYEQKKVEKLLNKIDASLSTEQKIKECLKLLIKI